MSKEIWTIGHSTLPLDDFVNRLRSFSIGCLVDVRRHPGSRKYPHFSAASLEGVLPTLGILYEHMPDLGGRRKPAPESKNTAWRNESFRAYAYYMETAEFEAAAGLLIGISEKHRTAIMCAESVWWRCHRALVSDWLKVRGFAVHHIGSAGGSSEHPYTSAAKVVDGRLSYSA